MATFITDEQESFLNDVFGFVGALENAIIRGEQQVWSLKEIEELLVDHIGQETWDYRKAQGVQDF